jgi:hypothetical protein
MSRHQNSGKNHNIKIANRSFENVTKLTYLGTAVTHQICINEEIMSRLNSGKVCYHSVQNLLSSFLLSKTLRIKTQKNNIILPVVLYGCEAWSLALGEEHRLKVLENWVPRRISGPIK